MLWLAAMLIATGLALLEVLTSFRLFSRAFGSFATYIILGILLAEAAIHRRCFSLETLGCLRLGHNHTLELLCQEFSGHNEHANAPRSCSRHFHSIRVCRTQVGALQMIWDLDKD